MSQDTKTKEYGAVDTGLSLDFVFRVCTGHDTSYYVERGELDWYTAYANPREDSGRGILTANWNHFPHTGAGVHPITYTSEQAQQFNWGKGRKFQDILEKMGYQLEWSDQTDRCEHCNGCIHTDASCYGDTAHYALLGESDIVCEECIRKDFAEEYLEGLEDNPRAAVAISGVDPAQYGYELIQGEYESGLHPGQNDNPKQILKSLQEKGVERVLFKVDDSGQFDVRFSVWKKAKRYEVVVGNIGTVYDGSNEAEAQKHYAGYVEQSKSGAGRAGSEEVALLVDGEISTEYVPPEEEEITDADC